jgi:hypothetical protein
MSLEHEVGGAIRRKWRARMLTVGGGVLVVTLVGLSGRGDAQTQAPASHCSTTSWTGRS